MKLMSNSVAIVLLAVATGACAGTATGLASLPYKASYDRLTPAQKDIVRESYDALPAEDEPPYPIDGIGALLRPLFYSSSHIHMNGRVDAIADVGADGVVRSVTLYQSPDPVVITPTVTQLLMLQKFKPGMCHGKPCAMPFALRVDLVD